MLRGEPSLFFSNLSLKVLIAPKISGKSSRILMTSLDVRSPMSNRGCESVWGGVLNTSVFVVVIAIAYAGRAQQNRVRIAKTRNAFLELLIKTIIEEIQSISHLYSVVGSPTLTFLPCFASPCSRFAQAPLLSSCFISKLLFLAFEPLFKI